MPLPTEEMTPPVMKMYFGDGSSLLTGSMLLAVIEVMCSSLLSLSAALLERHLVG